MTSHSRSDAAASAGPFTIRQARGEEDAAAVCAVRAGAAAHDGLDPLSFCEGVPSLEDVRAALRRAAETGQLDRRQVAEAAGAVAGYSVLNTWYEEDGRWVYLILGWVTPEWRGQGIGTAMLQRGEEMSRRLAAADHPGERFEFAGNASSSETEAAALLRDNGYFVGYTVVELQLGDGPLPAVSPLPPGIELRQVQPDHYPLIAGCMVEAYRNEYSGGRFLERETAADSEDALRDARHDPSLWQIAWEGEQVVGLVIPLIEQGRADFHDVSVRPAWRRRGLARALMTRALCDLRGRGVPVIRIHTVAEFPTRAVELYRSLGFELVKSFPRYRKGA